MNASKQQVVLADLSRKLAAMQELANQASADVKLEKTARESTRTLMASTTAVEEVKAYCDKTLAATREQIAASGTKVARLESLLFIGTEERLALQDQLRQRCAELTEPITALKTSVDLLESRLRLDSFKKLLRSASEWSMLSEFVTKMNKEMVEASVIVQNMPSQMY